MNNYRVIKKGGGPKRFPGLNKRQAYGGKVEMGKGGKNEYFLGGLVAPALGMAGGLLQKSKNPLLQKLGQGAGIASQVGSLMNPLGMLTGGGAAAGAAGGGGLMKALGGLLKPRSADQGMRVTKAVENGGETSGETSGGAFSSGIAQIEKQYNDLRMGVLTQLREGQREALKEAGIDPQTANVFDIIDAVPNFGYDRLQRAARSGGLPIPTGNAKTIYKKVRDGRIDPQKMDAMLSERGYEGPSAELFTQALATGRIPTSQMVHASKQDPKGARVMHEGKHYDISKNIPSGADFLEANKRLITRKGELKGDDALAFNIPRAVTRTDVTAQRPTEGEPMDPMAEKTPEIGKELQGEVTSEELATTTPTLDPIPHITLKEAPQPTEQITEAEEDPDPTTPDPMTPTPHFGEPMALAEPMRSDYLGGSEMRATGPFARQEAATEQMMSQPQLFAMMQSEGEEQRKGGVVLKKRRGAGRRMSDRELLAQLRRMLNRR